MSHQEYRKRIRFKQVLVTIPHASILTLPTVPFQVLPAPGPRYVIQPMYWFMRFDIGTPYGNAATAHWYLNYEGGDQAGLFSAAMLSGAGPEGPKYSNGVGGIVGAGAPPLSDYVVGLGGSMAADAGKALIVRDDYTSGNYTGGDPANRASLTLLYLLLDLTTGTLV